MTSNIEDTCNHFQPQKQLHVHSTLLIPVPVYLYNVTVQCR